MEFMGQDGDEMDQFAFIYARQEYILKRNIR